MRSACVCEGRGRDMVAWGSYGNNSNKVQTIIVKKGTQVKCLEGHVLVIVEAGWCGKRCSLGNSLYFWICFIISRMKSFKKCYGNVRKEESLPLCGILGKWFQRKSDNYGKGRKDRKDLNRWRWIQREVSFYHFLRNFLFPNLIKLAVFIVGIPGGPASLALSGLVHLAPLIPVALNLLGESKWWQVCSPGSARSSPIFCKNLHSRQCCWMEVEQAFSFNPAHLAEFNNSNCIQIFSKSFSWAKLQLKPSVPTWQRRKPPYSLGSNIPCHGSIYSSGLWHSVTGCIPCTDTIFNPLVCHHPMLDHALLGRSPHLLQTFIPDHQHGGPSHTPCGHLSCPALHPNPHAGWLPTCMWASNTYAGSFSQMDNSSPCSACDIPRLTTTTCESFTYPTGSDAPLVWMPSSLCLSSDFLPRHLPHGDVLLIQLEPWHLTKGHNVVVGVDAPVLFTDSDTPLGRTVTPLHEACMPTLQSPPKWIFS